MSFTRPIRRFRRYGRECLRVDVPLVVTGRAGEVRREFRFDTGCDITTVSEDVATALGLPSGGTPMSVSGSTATGVGRLVSVTFRFPPDIVSGLPGPNLSSMWAVVAGRTNVALLSFQEAQERYFLGSDDTDMYFTNR